MNHVGRTRQERWQETLDVGFYVRCWTSAQLDEHRTFNIEPKERLSGSLRHGTGWKPTLLLADGVQRFERANVQAAARDGRRGGDVLSHLVLGQQLELPPGSHDADRAVAG